MNIYEIAHLLKRYTIFAFFIVVFCLLFFCIINKFVYKKEIKAKKLIIPTIFLFYIVILLCATFAGRSSNYKTTFNWNLFSSYKEAYITGEKSAWLNLILNILIFIPMGFLLPLLSKKLNKWYKVVSVGFIITLIIEFTQLLRHVGIFEIDDIFNNTLGTIIGFFIIKIFFIIINKGERKKILKCVLCCMPLVLTILFFTIIFTKYNSQKYGNLDILLYTKTNMKDVTVEGDISFNVEERYLPVYSAKTYSKQEARQNADEIMKKMNLEIVRAINLDTFSIFHTESGIDMRYYYKGGTYTIDNTNISDDTLKENSVSNTGIAVQQKQSNAVTEKDIVIRKLEELGIEMNYDYIYTFENGYHIFTADMYDNKEYVTDGNLTIRLNENGGYEINNNIINYYKIDNCKIISENQAYQILLSGKYKSTFNEKIKKIKINSIEIDYMLDSKNYYQPVYKFKVFFNDMENDENIYIPAIIVK